LRRAHGVTVGVISSDGVIVGVTVGVISSDGVIVGVTVGSIPPLRFIIVLFFSIYERKYLMLMV
jgi:hypothetical protein